MEGGAGFVVVGLASNAASAGVLGGMRKKNKGLFLNETYSSATISPTHRFALEAMTDISVVNAWKPVAWNSVNLFLKYEL